MNGRLIFLTIGACLSLVAGCTTNTIIAPEEARRLKETKITMITPIAVQVIVEGLVLYSGSTVTFDEHGGLYNEERQSIVGQTDHGDSTEYLLSEIEFVRMIKMDRHNIVELIDVTTFKNEAKKKQWQLVGDKVYQPSVKVKFDNLGARYDSTSNSYTGRTRDGQQVEISRKDVLQIESKTTYRGKKITAVNLTHTFVKGFELRSGNHIICDKNCGKYDSKSKSITAIVRNQRIEIGLDTIRYVFLEKESIAGSEEITLDVEAFENYILNRKWGKIKTPRHLPDQYYLPGELIKFDHIGGVMNYEDQLISGTTETGEPVELKMNEIASIHERKFSLGKTLLLPYSGWALGILGAFIALGAATGGIGNIGPSFQ
ncbi:MAG: hypothetical protein IIC66_12935 [candidate division Zixibacteria bacterium]|nr:hypothetical protein [candidate division Zixibacteria bacterium]